MLAAVHAMSSGAQSLCFGLALLAFCLATLLAATAKPRVLWPALVSAGLALFALVYFVNALAR